jgi:hypothetical protein
VRKRTLGENCVSRFAHKAAKNCTVVLKKLHHYLSTSSLITNCLHFTAQLFLNERTHAQNSRCTQEGILNSESTKNFGQRETERAGKRILASYSRS